MRRVALLVLAALALAAAGCGDSPEDKAHDAGKKIGGDLYALQTATSAQDAGAAIDSIRDEINSIGGSLPQGYKAQLESIGQELRTNLQNASDASARRAAYLDAVSQFEQLNSDTNSVVNELRRGVHEGYEDASD